MNEQGALSDDSHSRPSNSWWPWSKAKAGGEEGAVLLDMGEYLPVNVPLDVLPHSEGRLEAAANADGNTAASMCESGDASKSGGYVYSDINIASNFD